MVRKEMVMGRWSELSWLWVDQVREGRRWAEAKEMSREEMGELLKGRRVGELRLRVQRQELSMAEARRSPLGSEGSRGENQ
jgi:hypothetical protein